MKLLFRFWQNRQAGKRLTRLIEEQISAKDQLLDIPRSESQSEATMELIRAIQRRTVLLSEASNETGINQRIRDRASCVVERSRVLRSDDGPFWNGWPDEDYGADHGYDGGAPIPATLIPKPPRRTGSDAKAFPVDGLDALS
jgi:hypothetical protein